MSNSNLIGFQPSDHFNNFGLDKVSHYNWEPLDQPGQFMNIDKRLIFVDRSYQREESKKKVLEIASTFKWRACGVITVMRRADGTYLAVDGQHRVLSSHKRSDIETLPCYVFPSPGAQEEAKCFIETNTNRKPVTAFSKFKANMVAKDAKANAIKEIIESNGFHISPKGTSVLGVSCIALCNRIFSQNENLFVNSFSLAAELCKADNAHLDNRLLASLAYLDTAVEEGLQNELLRSRLKKIGAIALVDSASKMSFRTGLGGSKVWAQGMLEIVNRVRGKKITMKGVK